MGDQMKTAWYIMVNWASESVCCLVCQKGWYFNPLRIRVVVFVIKIFTAEMHADIGNYHVFPIK